MIKLLCKSGDVDWKRSPKHRAARCAYGDHAASRLLSVDGRNRYACINHQAELELSTPAPEFVPTPPMPAMTAPPRARLSTVSDRLPTKPSVPPSPEVPTMSSLPPIPVLVPNHRAKVGALHEHGPATYPQLQRLWGATSVGSARATGGRLIRLGVLEWEGDRIRVSELGLRALASPVPLKPSVKRAPPRKVRPVKKVAPVVPEVTVHEAKKTNGTNGSRAVNLDALAAYNGAHATKKPIVVRLDDMVIEVPTVADVVELRRALRGA